MNLFRFYVGMQDKMRRPLTQEVRALIDAQFTVFGQGGYTMTLALGVWEGVQEPTRIYDVVVDADREEAQAFAARIASISAQYCVLVVELSAIATLVPAAWPAREELSV